MCLLGISVPVFWFIIVIDMTLHVRVYALAFQHLDSILELDYLLYRFGFYFLVLVVL